MFFLPYKMDSRKAGLPLFTVLICIICVFVYWQQYSEDQRHYRAIHDFCVVKLERSTASIVDSLSDYKGPSACYDVFESVRQAPDAEQKLWELAEQAPQSSFFSQQDSRTYIYKELLASYQLYEYEVPGLLTMDLAFDPNNIDLVKMVTATFSHADLLHLLGNLLFFYIFAASVELIIGNLMFAVFILVTTFGTNFGYSHVMANVEGALPTVGLSGVVMAMVAALAVMMPNARIRCFLWFFIIIKIWLVIKFCTIYAKLVKY